MLLMVTSHHSNFENDNHKFTNWWSYTSTPQYVFMARCLVKNGGNFDFFYFTLLYFTVTNMKGIAQSVK